MTSLEMLAQHKRAMVAVRRASVLPGRVPRPSAGPRLRAGRPAARRPPSRTRWWERHGEVGAVTGAHQIRKRRDEEDRLRKQAAENARSFVPRSTSGAVSYGQGLVLGPGEVA